MHHILHLKRHAEMLIQMYGCNHFVGKMRQQKSWGIKKWINNIIVDKQFLRHGMNDIWMVTNSLQQMLKWSTIM
jgi:hypothetical protein